MLAIRVFSASLKAVQALAAAACEACILSCKLQVPPEKRRDDTEEEAGYLMGETDPLSSAVSGETIAGFAGDDSDDRIVPLEAAAPSAEVLSVDKLDKALMGDAIVVVEEAKFDLNNNAEVYKFAVDFGDSGGVTEVKVLSSMDPGDDTEIGLEDNEAASPLIDTGSVLVLRGEDMRPVETGAGYWAC